MLGRFARAWAFARHVPPSQIGRRLFLRVRTAVETRLRPRLDRHAPPPLAAELPPPLFAPRAGLVEHDGLSWRFTFIGHSESLPDPIDWARPPSTASVQLWRMNLHYMEYLEAVDDTAFLSLVGQWQAANPPFAPGAHHDAWNAYAASLRVVVLCQQLAARRMRIGETQTARLAGLIAVHLRYLAGHLETDIGGNHLIKNIKALLWGSAMFEGPEALRWRRIGVALLRRELARQMLPGGMHFELSPSYHCQVLADLAEIRHAIGDPLGGALDAALARGAQVVADLAHPDGMVAQFSDSGLHMAYAPAEILTAIAPGAQPRATFIHGDAGYRGARTKDCLLVFDTGRIAPDALPAHGHGDIFSFEWSIGGARCVVDQGVYEYVAGTRRARSRTAATHNTLWAPGHDQGEFFGAFRLGRRACVRIHEEKMDGETFTVEASHDGFLATGGAVHRRRVHGTPRHFRIEDRLDGPAMPGARVALLLHPEVAVQQIDASTVRLRCGKGSAMLQGAHPISACEAVWWPDMGIEMPTTRLVMELPEGAGECWLEATVQ